jgi:hypothetical protein
MDFMTTSDAMAANDDAEIPPAGRELAIYMKDMLASLRRCAGAPYFGNLRALLLAAEQEAGFVADGAEERGRVGRA